MKRYILSIAALAVLSTGVFAQNTALLNSYTDAQSAAIGGSTAAIGATAYAVTNNPAAMSLYDGKSQIGASYGSWAPKLVKFGSIGAAGFVKLGKFALGADFKYFLEPAYNTYSAAGTPISTFKPSDLGVALGASYGIGEKFSIGLTAKILSSKISEATSKTAFGMDLMGMFKSGGLSVAAGVSNLGSKAGAVKAGAAYTIAGFTATADGQYIFSGGYMASIGAQYCIADIVTPRVGYHLGSGNYAVGSFLSAGLGLNLGKFRINGSYFITGDLANTFCAGLGVAF